MNKRVRADQKFDNTSRKVNLSSEPGHSVSFYSVSTPMDAKRIRERETVR